MKYSTVVVGFVLSFLALSAPSAKADAPFTYQLKEQRYEYWLKGGYWYLTAPDQYDYHAVMVASGTVSMSEYWSDRKQYIQFHINYVVTLTDPQGAANEGSWVYGGGLPPGLSPTAYFDVGGQGSGDGLVPDDATKIVKVTGDTSWFKAPDHQFVWELAAPVPQRYQISTLDFEDVGVNGKVASLRSKLEELRGKLDAANTDAEKKEAALSEADDALNAAADYMHTFEKRRDAAANQLSCIPSGDDFRRFYDAKSEIDTTARPAFDKAQQAQTQAIGDLLAARAKIKSLQDAYDDTALAKLKAASQSSVSSVTVYASNAATSADVFEASSARPDVAALTQPLEDQIALAADAVEKAKQAQADAEAELLDAAKKRATANDKLVQLIMDRAYTEVATELLGCLKDVVKGAVTEGPFGAFAALMQDAIKETALAVFTKVGDNQDFIKEFSKALDTKEQPAEGGSSSSSATDEAVRDLLQEKGKGLLLKPTLADPASEALKFLLEPVEKDIEEYGVTSKFAPRTADTLTLLRNTGKQLSDLKNIVKTMNDPQAWMKLVQEKGAGYLKDVGVDLLTDLPLDAGKAYMKLQVARAWAQYLVSDKLANTQLQIYRKQSDLLAALKKAYADLMKTRSRVYGQLDALIQNSSFQVTRNLYFYEGDTVTVDTRPGIASFQYASGSLGDSRGTVGTDGLMRFNASGLSSTGAKPKMVVLKMSLSH